MRPPHSSRSLSPPNPAMRGSQPQRALFQLLQGFHFPGRALTLRIRSICGEGRASASNSLGWNPRVPQLLGWGPWGGRVLSRTSGRGWGGGGLYKKAAWESDLESPGLGLSLAAWGQRHTPLLGAGSALVGGAGVVSTLCGRQHWLCLEVCCRAGQVLSGGHRGHQQGVSSQGTQPALHLSAMVCDHSGGGSHGGWGLKPTGRVVLTRLPGSRKVEGRKCWPREPATGSLGQGGSPGATGPTCRESELRTTARAEQHVWQPGPQGSHAGEVRTTALPGCPEPQDPCPQQVTGQEESHVLGQWCQVSGVASQLGAWEAVVAWHLQNGAGGMWEPQPVRAGSVARGTRATEVAGCWDSPAPAPSQGAWPLAGRRQGVPCTLPGMALMSGSYVHTHCVCVCPRGLPAHGEEDPG